MTDVPPGVVPANHGTCGERAVLAPLLPQHPHYRLYGGHMSMYERLKMAGCGHRSLVKKITGDTGRALKEKIGKNTKKNECFT
jgi:hypothetical protein